MLNPKWMPVNMLAEWIDPQPNEITILVIGLLMDDTEIDGEDKLWRGMPTHALIVRKKYMGSDHHPLYEMVTEAVPFPRIRLFSANT